MTENEGKELTGENLDQVAGGKIGGSQPVGWEYVDEQCKKCGGHNVYWAMGYTGISVSVRYECRDCGYSWDNGLG